MEGGQYSITGSEAERCGTLRTHVSAGRSISSDSNSFRKADSRSPRSCRRERLRRPWTHQGTLEGRDLLAVDDPLGLPRAGPPRRPFLSRRGRTTGRTSGLAGAQPVQLGDGRLLSGEEGSALAILLRRGPSGRANSGRPGEAPMVVERPPHPPVRRVDGLDARHSGEPQRLSPDLQPEAGNRVRRRADRGDDLAVVRGDPRPGHLPYAGKGQSESGCCGMWGLFEPATSWSRTD